MSDESLAGIRILHIHTLPVVSGSGINTLLTMQGSRDVGASVSLASAPGGRLEKLVRKGEMSFVPIRNFVSELSLWKDCHAFWQLDRLLASQRFDIVHTHNSKAGFLGRLAAWRQGVPIIVHTIHGFAFHQEESWLRRRVFVLAERVAAGWCHQMIAISQPMLDWALRERISGGRSIEKIYSGIQLDEFRTPEGNPALRDQFGIRPDHLVVGVVAKLWEGKGHDVLIDAVSVLRRRGHLVQLLIVGEGPLEERLRRQVQRLGIESAVAFTGFRSDIPEITALLDISVLPSFYEGMGRVVLEAMACGKPVVASKVGGLLELVSDGVTGYLVPPGNVDALVERLEKLLTDGQLRSEMGARALQRVRKEHSAAEMVHMIHRVYARFLDQLDNSPETSGNSRGPDDGSLRRSPSSIAPP